MLGKGKQNARDKKRTIKYIQEIHREVADVCYHGNCTCSTFTIVILLRKRQGERDLQVTSLHLNRYETKESCLWQKNSIESLAAFALVSMTTFRSVYFLTSSRHN